MTQIDGRIYLDANIFIYAMELDDDRGMLARRWLGQVDRGRVPAATSELTVVEVLPHPLSIGNARLVQAYRELLAHRPTLEVLPVRAAILSRAAELRAQFKSETPDAIHVATALSCNCTGFLTEDTRLKLPPSLRRHVLQDVMALYP